MFALLWKTKRKGSVFRANTIMMLQCLFCTICIQNFKICCFSIHSFDAFAVEWSKSQHKNSFRSSLFQRFFLSFHFAFHQGRSIETRSEDFNILGENNETEESSRRSTLANRHQRTMAFRIYGDEQKGSMNKARCSLMVCKMILQYSSGERSCLAGKPRGNNMNFLECRKRDVRKEHLWNYRFHFFSRVWRCRENAFFVSSLFKTKSHKTTIWMLRSGKKRRNEHLNLKFPS